MALSLTAKPLFTAHGTDLKISSNCMAPFIVKDGICQLGECRRAGQYEWKISDSRKDIKRHKNFLFYNAISWNTDIKIRDCQFTVTVKAPSEAGTTILTGILSSNEEVDTLNSIVNKISKRLNTNGTWLSATKENIGRSKIQLNNSSVKENSQTPVSSRKPPTPFASRMKDKTPVRKVLSDLSTKHSKSNPTRTSLFPSPSQVKQVLSENSDIETDIQVTAIGGRKAAQFYNNSGNARLTATKAFSMKKSIPSPYTAKSYTFQQRKKENVPLTFIPDLDNNNSVSSLVGFSNLGNTCYMNAILQCLLNIPNFFQDLNNQQNLESVKHKSLYNSLCNLGLLKYSHEKLHNQRYALQRVKDAISSAAQRFSGYAQHDAHEFLCQCLDQLKEDVLIEMKNKYNAEGIEWSSSDEQNVYTCPIKENFESTIVHAIVCQNCNEQVLKTEVCHDFSLVLPESDENFDPSELNVPDLLKQYFSNEVIEYTCEKCQGTSSVLMHQFSQLPRVLILHMKRYNIFDIKRTDKIMLPKNLGVDYLVQSNTRAPKPYTYKKDKFTGSNHSIELNSKPEKRKSNQPLQNEPLYKVWRQSEKLGFQNSFLPSNTCKGNKEGELLAQACRDSIRDENLRKIKHEEISFTKLKPSDSKSDSQMNDVSSVNRPIPFNASTPIVGRNMNLVDIEDDNDDFEKSLTDILPDEKEIQIKITSDAVKYETENNHNKTIVTEISDIDEKENDEEEQYKKAIELSLREFEDSQKELLQNCLDSTKSNFELDSFLVNDINSKVHIENDETEIMTNLTEQDNLYQLVGVVNHHGQNTGTGHYTSDSYDFKSMQWHHYDDTTVKDVKEHEVRFGRNESAYIVFYMHTSCFNAIATSI